MVSLNPSVVRNGFCLLIFFFVILVVHSLFMVNLMLDITTAVQIAQECGILFGDGIAMEGREFRHLNDDELRRVMPRLQVLARSTPVDKLRLVTK